MADLKYYGLQWKQLLLVGCLQKLKTRSIVNLTMILPLTTCTAGFLSKKVNFNLMSLMSNFQTIPSLNLTPPFFFSEKKLFIRVLVLYTLATPPHSKLYISPSTPLLQRTPHSKQFVLLSSFIHPLQLLQS